MLLSLNDVDLRLGGPMLLDRAALTVEPGERLALLGRNGAGKSSLLRLIAGELTPDAGQLRLESGIRIALLPQEIPTHWTGTAAGIARHQDPAGEHETPAWQTERWLTELGVDPATDFATLSGGMKRRVLLAHALAREPDLLLLDEPTNHLDLETREALVLALAQFEGTLIVVSHDRHLLRATTDQFLLVTGGAVRPYDGDLDDYRVWLLKEAAQRRTAPAKAEPAKTVPAPLRPKPRLGPLTKELVRIETQLDRLATDIDGIETALADPALYTDADRDQLADLLRRQAQARAEQERLEARWLDLQAEIETASS